MPKRLAPGSAILMATVLAIAAAIYWPGLSGGYLFDDFPNIVNNKAIHMERFERGELTLAALSSPSSEFKRPLASISFAVNHLATGLDPFWMKLTNLAIHLLNGILVFILSRQIFRATGGNNARRSNILSLLVAAGWLLLPINLSAVLYVVQRMEAMANLFVLLGLIGYTSGRLRILDSRPGLLICATSLTMPTFLGLLAKETAVVLPLYAFLVELVIFQWRGSQGSNRDTRIAALFVIVLAVPLAAGLAWLLPSVLNSATWTSRDFTLGERLLSEARIVCSYVGWTLLPRPNWLPFYHDDFTISKGLLQPWTTLLSIAALASLAVVACLIRKHKPIVTLGLTLFLSGHLLTGTILPLELVYEHRNYFPSLGLLLVVVPLLAADRSESFALPRNFLLGSLLISWAALTAMTAHAWGNPLRQATELAARNPGSPRAQYELGFTYVVISGYEHDSPFIPLAQAQLTKAAYLPHSSILAEHALIVMNARLGAPIKDSWWQSIEEKLVRKKPSLEDVEALISLARCTHIEDDCHLPKTRMTRAFLAGLSHPNPSPRLLAAYAAHAWNVLEDPVLAHAMAIEAVTSDPSEPAYRITLTRILAGRGYKNQAIASLEELRALNVGKHLDGEIKTLEELIINL